MITNNDLPIRSAGFLIREIGEETILINQEGNILHTLDEVGTFIWKKINGKNSIARIIEKICEEYKVEQAVAEKDVFKFLNELLSNKIISFKDKK